MLMPVVLFRGWRSDLYLTWGAVGFVFLARFLTAVVWQKYFDITRAVAPLITAFVLLVFIRQERSLGRSTELR